jgi:hypothetical protein
MIRLVYGRITVWMCRRFDISPLFAHVIMMACMGIAIGIAEPSTVSRLHNLNGFLNSIVYPGAFCIFIIFVNFLICGKAYVTRPSRGGGLR